MSARLPIVTKRRRRARRRRHEVVLAGLRWLNAEQRRGIATTAGVLLIARPA